MRKKKPWFGLGEFINDILFDLYARYLVTGNLIAVVGETPHKHSLCTTTRPYLNSLDFCKFKLMECLRHITQSCLQFY